MIEQTNFQMPQKRHSRLGIISTVIGLLLPILMLFFIVSGSSLDTKRGSVGNDIIGTYFLISLTFPILHLVGLILGIIGLFFKKAKKVFPIIGIILNFFLLLVGIGLVYLGLLVLSAASGVR